MQQKKTATSQTGIVGLDDGQRGRHGDRRVKGIAATREDIVACLCGQWMRAGYARRMRRRRGRDDNTRQQQNQET
jgi:hypothetical protein